jgi:hypothetical protein
MSTPSIGPAPALAGNPLIRKGQDTPKTEGAGLFHDVTEAVSGFSDGNWAEGWIRDRSCTSTSPSAGTSTRTR